MTSRLIAALLITLAALVAGGGTAAAMTYDAPRSHCSACMTYD